MNEARPKGYVPDSGPRLALFSEPLGAEVPKQAGAVAREPWADLVQQGQSCTWHGLAQACYGLTGEKTSPYTGWWYGRALRHPGIAADPRGIMPDEGIALLEILDSAATSGTCRWDLWRPGMEGFSIHAEPFGAASIESQARNFDLSVVAGTGDALANAAAVSIDSGEVPLLALDVDQAFEDFNGNGVIREQSGPSLGGHMVALWKHELTNGERMFLLVNSWRDWGLNNTAWISERRIRQARQVYRVRGVG